MNVIIHSFLKCLTISGRSEGGGVVLAAAVLLVGVVVLLVVVVITIIFHIYFNVIVQIKMAKFSCNKF
jgi:hypothetical protein